jgi:hypothetical protein
MSLPMERPRDDRRPAQQRRFRGIRRGARCIGQRRSTPGRNRAPKEVARGRREAVRNIPRVKTAVPQSKRVQRRLKPLVSKGSSVYSSASNKLNLTLFFETSISDRQKIVFERKAWFVEEFGKTIVLSNQCVAANSAVLIARESSTLERRWDPRYDKFYGGFSACSTWPHTGMTQVDRFGSHRYVCLA